MVPKLLPNDGVGGRDEFHAYPLWFIHNYGDIAAGTVAQITALLAACRQSTVGSIRAVRAPDAVSGLALRADAIARARQFNRQIRTDNCMSSARQRQEQENEEKKEYRRK